MNATLEDGGSSQGIWSTDPAITAAVHMPIFEKYFAPDLPLVDADCGSGAQTVFLAGRFHPCVGIDRSAAALERARTAVGEGAGGRSAPDFRQLDTADPAAMRRLHEELGDANVYLRGVLRRGGPAGRARVAESVAALVGERGRAFVVEAAPESDAALAQGAGAAHPAELSGPLDTPGLSDLPHISGAPEDSGRAPAGRAEHAGPFIAAGLRVLAAGSLPLSTTDFEPDGSRLDLPSNWLVVGRAG
ncbi:TPMT family class I SAM-dependent methyltransferase [Streptomyces sp. CNQ085]|uniref:TPMT family class I SAM-dependent methyltransferase n=1 Tax=Streptomyces sp. CNQ085 TaxID=2886944 RepID=UPI001F513CB6|nr:TPMT family class I SAM-dependent methyltransferase [Streptomyces sp. CNQ085]MCI0384408.1 TPMT family class I SAM-dependent methyltransferase [Streptomyces sp. CNQ085]